MTPPPRPALPRSAHRIGNTRGSAAPARGFTLIELIVTLVIFAVLSLTLALVLRPTVSSYLGQRNRAGMQAEADAALRLMLRDVRAAVPNSIRSPSSDCVELIPSSGGGRYRMADDTVNGGALALDTSAPSTGFDVLSPMSRTPAVGDWVVVDNQNPGDVYAGSNRAQITAVSTPAASAGTLRLSFASTQFPLGYDGGRFTVVPNAQQAVFYVCSGASSALDSQGDAPGVLYRLKNYGFNSAMPGSCPSTAGADVVARRVSSCRFLYDPNQGATQQSGFVSIELSLTRDRETASLVVGAHVVNQP